jgi:hypothetical protein
MAKRTDNTMAKRTDNTMAKRTDNTMAKRTDNTMAKRKDTTEQTTISPLLVCYNEVKKTVRHKIVIIVLYHIHCGT